MITHIHHLNILVRDLAQSASYWSALLQQQPDMDALPGRGVHTARFTLGETHLVLVSPESEASVLWPLLQKQGEGLFLLSLGTEDLKQSLDKLSAEQLAEPTSVVRQGLLNWQVCDISAPAFGEHVLQLCEEIRPEIDDEQT